MTRRTTLDTRAAGPDSTGRVNSRMVELRMRRLPGSPMLATNRRVARTSVWFLGVHLIGERVVASLAVF
jgi:hypothetical protein